MSGKLLALQIQHLVKYITGNCKLSSNYVPYNSCGWYIPKPLQLATFVHLNFVAIAGILVTKVTASTECTRSAALLLASRQFV